MPTTIRLASVMVGLAGLEAEALPEHFVARLVVPTLPLPLAAPRGGGARVGGESPADLLVDGLFQLGLVGEGPDHLAPHVFPGLLVAIFDRHAFGGLELRDDPVGQVEDALPAQAHQRMNPRSRASFPLTIARRRAEAAGA